MENFRVKLARFFAGRYGLDALGKALMYGYLALAVVNLFLQSFLLSVLEILLLVFWMYRILSRNIPARVRENDKYLALRDKVIRWGKLQKNRWRDRKTHVYRTCPHCKAIVRLPKSRRGKHTCDCPRCRREFSVRI